MTKTKDEISIKRQLAASSFRYLMGTHWVPTEKWSVLMYHRVTNPEDVPYPLQPGMYVRPETFRMHLEFLSKNARVIPLTELIREVEAGERKEKKKTVAITFDDGWNDFADHAYPLLKEFNTPASVFLPTAYIGSSRLFWTDQLSLYLDSLYHSEKRSTITHRIKESCSDVSLSGLFTSFLESTGNNSMHIFEKLIEKIKSIGEEERRIILATISNITREYSHPSCPPQFLDWTQVKDISDEGLLGFGSHGHNHAILTQLNSRQIKDDITESVQMFREKSIPCLPVFCYPNQERNTVTDAIVLESGFTHSLGNVQHDDSESSQTKLPCLRRTGIHQDVASSAELFALRIWLT